MKRTFLFLVVLFSFLSGTDVRAQLLMDQAMGMGAGIGEGRDPDKEKATTAMILNRLKIQGYTNVVAAGGNPPQFTATAPTGMKVTLSVDPLTGQVFSAVPR